MKQQTTLRQPVVSLSLVTLQFSLITLLSYLLIRHSNHALELLHPSLLIGYAAAGLLGL